MRGPVYEKPHDLAASLIYSLKVDGRDNGQELHDDHKYIGTSVRHANARICW